MDDKTASSVLHTWQSEAHEIARLAETVDLEILGQVIDRISTCTGKVIVTGCGTSAMAARKIVHSLNCIDVAAQFLDPADAVHGALGTVKKDDIVIFISKGGSTSQLTAFADNVRKKRAFIITVSENEDSLLGKAADLMLKVKVEREPDEFNMLATASTLAVIAVFDAVCIAVMQKTGYSREAFALNHPSGAVGERLLNNKK